MTFRWQLPNDPPDPAALARMKQYFPKPTELMPVAWFMGEKIDYYTNLATPPDNLSAEELVDALGEIALGILAFPQVHFVPVWREWFTYLLPYAINRADEHSMISTVLTKLICALLINYPDELPEVYADFRNDLVYSLGTRLTFPSLFRLAPSQDMTRYASLEYLIVKHIWESDGEPQQDQLNISKEFSYPMLFCLKYLHPDEIESWTASITEINSPQWHIALVGWWLALEEFLRLAHHWPSDGNIERWLDDETGLITDFCLKNYPFTSLEQLLPRQNLAVFQAALKQHLSLERFHTWATEIKAQDYIQIDEESFPIDEESRSFIAHQLQAFEAQFFTA